MGAVFNATWWIALGITLDLLGVVYAGLTLLDHWMYKCEPGSYDDHEDWGHFWVGMTVVTVALGVSVGGVVLSTTTAGDVLLPRIVATFIVVACVGLAVVPVRRVRYHWGHDARRMAEQDREKGE